MVPDLAEGCPRFRFSFCLMLQTLVFFLVVNNSPFNLKKLETIETAPPLNVTSGEGLDMVPEFNRRVVPE